MATKSFAFRLTSEGADKVIADLRQAAITSAEAQRALMSLTQASPQLASVQDNVANKMKATSAAMKEQASAANALAASSRGGVGGGVNAALGSMGGIGGGFAAGGAIGAGMAAAQAVVDKIKAAIDAIPQAGDVARQSIGQLTATLGDAGQAALVFERLQDLSRQTGVAVADSAAAFQRFSIAAKDIGATNNQVLELVAGIQKFGIVGGASMQATEAATMQLGQALASGRLQGDELRSILENMPDFARALAKELGTNTGGLREMGAAGKLSSDVVFPAILRAAQGIDEVFQKMPLTMARAQQQYDAAAQSFMAHLDQSLGLSDKLIGSLERAARLVNAIRRGTGGATRDERVTSLTDEQNARGAEVSAYDQAIADARAAGADGQSIGILVRNRTDAAAAFEKARRELAAINTQVVREEEAQQEAAEENRLSGARSRSTTEVAKLREDLDRKFKINKEYQDRIDQLARGRDLGTISDGDFASLSALAIKDRDEGLKKLGGSAKEAKEHVSELDDVMKKLREKQANMARSVETELDPVAAAYQRLADQVRKINEGVGSGFIDPSRGEELRGMAWSGLTKSLDSINKEGKNADDTFNRFFANAASGFEQAIVRGERFGNVIKALGQDIATLILRMTVTGPAMEAIKGLGLGSMAQDFFKGIFSSGTNSAAAMQAVPTVIPGMGVQPFADGGIMTSRGRLPLKRYAGGGIADTPQTAIFGEGSQPEAYVPLADGRSIPVTMRGGANAAPSISVNVTVTNSNASPALIAAAVRQGVADGHAQLMAEINRGGAWAKTVGRRR